jgi:hypothetical protein
MSSKWFVSRQHYYYQNIYVVEIATPSIDYASPDMLIEKYRGEGEEYSDPIEAFQNAITVLNAWKRDEPEKEIGLTYGHFDSCEGEPQEIEEIKKQLYKEYESLPKCDYCNRLLEEEFYTNPDSEFSGEKFCSAYHAEKAYGEGYEVCSVCEREFQRKELNQLEEYDYICDTCKESEE